MAADPVTPLPGLTNNVQTGGSAVVVVPPGPNGGFIVNPIMPADQGLAVAEELYINPYTDATTSAFDTTFRIEPGQSWDLIPGQTTQTSVNAPSSGHRFSVIYY